MPVCGGKMPPMHGSGFVARFPLSSATWPQKASYVLCKVELLMLLGGVTFENWLILIIVLMISIALNKEASNQNAQKGTEASTCTWNSLGGSWGKALFF